MFSRQAVLRAARSAAPQRALLGQTRSFAAPASADKVKPPVTLFGLDGTYATALYTAAVKTQTLEPTAKGIEKLGALLQKDSKLVTILEAPTLTAADKSAIVAELQKSAGAAGETVKNFLATLAENNRLGLLPGVCSKFGELMSAARGEVEMVVTSAQPLDNKTLARLEAAVSKSDVVGAGKTLKVKNTVNPDIIGGLIVEVGDRTVDLSVSSKIAKMNKLLTDAL
ncbi:mitochondrial ATP synthase subunit 5-like protein [Thermochaetoides thermophila DSM 1495]|uniref:ATP synthase subunit 5, mitochondrial n=1 Tax=Chaetomium thermophilum (strain DSM 1495 / CBS 144.50 / IMI 039719) TaxID=759272 RepID=G0RY90_CHATD|nr:mitochondrial ATP synthase subunit 5-like protein [Thermochaetoides thermophila DSM 1495]EGS23876.1 mitochondrial ATP synthase subunit 5-like protein [Thermochaetoides thermophila DSM 1495]